MTTTLDPTLISNLRDVIFQEIALPRTDVFVRHEGWRWEKRHYSWRMEATETYTENGEERIAQRNFNVEVSERDLYDTTPESIRSLISKQVRQAMERQTEDWLKTVSNPHLLDPKYGSW